MLNSLLAALNDCVWAFDVDTQKYLFISPSIHAVTEYQVKDFQKNIKLWGEIIDPRDREDVLATNQRPDGNEWSERTFRITTKGGKIKWVQQKTQQITDEHTNHQIILSVIVDVSYQKQVSFNLKESLGDYSMLFNNNPTPMWIYELPTLRIMKVNDAAIKHYGYTEQDFLSMTIRDIRPRLDLAKFNNYLYQKAIPESSLHGFNNAGVWRHVNKKGEIVYAEITGHEIKYDNHSCRIIIATDVTDKVLQQEALKRREQFLTSLVDSQTNFLVRIDAAYNFTFANKWFFKTLGYKEKDIIGAPFSKTVLAEEYELCERAFKSCIKNPGKVISLKHRKVDTEGNSHWIKWEFIAILDENGEVSELQGVGQDVTQNIEIEKEVKKASEKLNSFVESITDAFFIVNNDWKFIRVNSAFEKITGKPREEILGSVIWDIFPDIVATEFEDAYRKAMNEEISVQFTDYFKPLSKWFNTTVYPASEGLTVFIRDITYEMHVQEEILWTKNNLEALINNTEDLTWSIDRNGKYVYMNSAYRKRISNTTGVTPEEGDNAYLYSGSTDEINAEWRSYYQRAFDGERYVIRHESLNPKTKENDHFEVSFNPIYKGTKDKIIGVGCFARNITERLKTEEALIEQNERLKNIASLSSHELRRPVASMIGLLNILDRDNFSNPENKQIMDHLHTVTQEIDEVIRLIVNKTFIDSRFHL
ncbi:PAS domain S-box protein [Mucilaginibacter sp. BT774]|uniref:PAS domain-containing sensor histidine kinase n=1 Tax=Mucilaginibacter sp. BT774 TaxID=3062276 RepID=UPI0026771FD9|nr:PAS domain S-box protein [Mucilaginibacter sp. BT774]MDO3628449.1 PAS domain S-box protein [Mucilaginibacter sp. BT774]